MSRATSPAWKTIPSRAVVGAAYYAIPPALQLAMAGNAHARITEVNGPAPGHDLRSRRRDQRHPAAVRATT